MHIAVLIGTRPEAIKMSPIIYALRKLKSVSITICSSGQHKEMLSQAFQDFNIHPDIDLNVMTEAQSLAMLTGTL